MTFRSQLARESRGLATNNRLVSTKQLLDVYREVRDVAVRDQVVVTYLPLVRRLCRRFFHTGEPLEDLCQVGSIGLIKAVEKFDTERSSNFTDFAIPVIIGEIKNYLRDHGWSVKVPRKLQQHKMAVGRSVEALNQRLGRSPTVQEIAADTGLSEEDVYDTFELTECGRPLSLDAQIDSADRQARASLLDFIGGEDPQFQARLNKIDLEEAINNLDNRRKTIIHLKFYQGLPQTEIARRLGISQMHVSRLQREAINQIKVNLMR